jgi:hypothetical protein
MEDCKVYLERGTRYPRRFEESTKYVQLVRICHDILADPTDYALLAYTHFEFRKRQRCINTLHAS